MDTLVQQTVNGLMLGSLYALIALGYTMVYGILRIINFAHGDVLMVGALSALSAIGVLQHHFPALPPYATLLLASLFAMAVCAITSMAIERLAYRRLRNAPRTAPLISGIGVSLLLQTGDADLVTQSPDVSAAVADDAHRLDRRQRRTCAGGDHRHRDRHAGGGRGGHGRPLAAGRTQPFRPRHARHGGKPAGRRPDGHQS